MSRPDFTKISYRPQENPAKPELESFSASEGSFETVEKIPVKKVYSQEDIKDFKHVDYVSGIPPFLRGPYPAMYKTRPWTVRQYAGYSTAEESNAFYRRNLEAGQKGLSIAFDLATHRGYDSDHPVW